MDILKRVCLTIAGLARQIWLLPQLVSGAMKERRLRVARTAQETERLDRIRNPSKYLGK